MWVVGEQKQGVLGICWHMGMLVTCGGQGEVCVWRKDKASSWRRVGKSHGHEGNVNCVASCGANVVSAGDDGTMRVWRIDADQGVVECARVVDAGAEQRGAGEQDSKGVTCMCVHGQRVFSGVHVRNEVLMWDAETWELTGRMAGHESWVSGMSVVMDGDLLATVSYDCSLRIWNVKGRFVFAACQPVMMPTRGDCVPLLGVATMGMSTDEQGAWHETLATIAEDGRVALWVVDSSEGALNVRHATAALHAKDSLLFGGDWHAAARCCSLC